MIVTPVEHRSPTGTHMNKGTDARSMGNDEDNPILRERIAYIAYRAHQTGQVGSQWAEYIGLPKRNPFQVVCNIWNSTQIIVFNNQC